MTPRLRRALLVLPLAVAAAAATRGCWPTGLPGAVMGFVFLAVVAAHAGDVFTAMRLPRMTGYLVCGLAVGPEVGRLVTPDIVSSLRVVSGVAVGLIAITAGSELDLRAMRPRLRTVLWITACAVPLALSVTAGLAMALAPRLPFLAALVGAHRATAAFSLGVVLASLSPAVVIGILAETASAGPVSEVALGVVVIADIVIIALFTSAQSLGARVFGLAGAPSGMSPALALCVEVFGSAGVGACAALALAACHRWAPRAMVWAILAACVASAELGARAHLDALLIALTAGLLLRNALRVDGAAVTRALAPASLPIFAVFFALAGAGVRVHELRAVWPYALVFAAARAATLMAGAWAGAAVARAEPAVRRWGMWAMVPQAGVSVGLVELLARHHPTWGASARSLLLSVIAVNELVGPVVLREALTRAGEVGRRVSIRVPGAP